MTNQPKPAQTPMSEQTRHIVDRRAEYEAPTVTSLGTLVDHTAGGGGNTDDEPGGFSMGV